EVPMLLWDRARARVEVICGQGPAPAAAAIERVHALGLGEIPGTGLLAACVPGAFAGWLTLLRDHGTWRLEDVLSFAIEYAASGLRAFYSGFVAEAVERHCRAEFMDSSGTAHAGLLTGDDLARFSARREDPVMAGFGDWTVAKCGPWSQGPVFLQQLRLLERLDLPRAGFLSADHVHLVTECAKLAFADREAWYADPDFAAVPL